MLIYHILKRIVKVIILEQSGAEVVELLPTDACAICYFRCPVYGKKKSPKTEKETQFLLMTCRNNLED